MVSESTARLARNALVRDLHRVEEQIGQLSQVLISVSQYGGSQTDFFHMTYNKRTRLREPKHV
jgi:hypothetical protein